MSVATQVTDFHWLAGFLEGEGHFAFYGTTPHVQVSQVQREPLEKVVQLVGGKIRGPYQHKKLNHTPFYEIGLAGSRAVGVMMTLFSLLSVWKQNQIKAALVQWKALPVANKYKTQCQQGHEYSVRACDGKRHCKTCDAAKARKHRAAQKEFLCQ